MSDVELALFLTTLAVQTRLRKLSESRP
jgi:hypothetical protein